jgi:hypothetical protein
MSAFTVFTEQTQGFSISKRQQKTGKTGKTRQISN